MASASEPVPIEPAWQRRLSVAEYHRLIDAGVFDEGDRFELLEGVLVVMSPQGVPHAKAITRLSRLAFRATDPTGLELRVQLPLTLARSEPEPDLAITDPQAATPRGRHPESAVLVVEVASDSLGKDLGPKATLYAEAGVLEYWVVNLDQHCVDVFAGPDPVARTYRTSRRAGAGETLTCHALPRLRVAVDELF